MLDCRENKNINLEVKKDLIQIQCEAHDSHFDCNTIGSTEHSVQCLEIINENPSRFECFDFKHKK